MGVSNPARYGGRTRQVDIFTAPADIDNRPVIRASQITSFTLIFFVNLFVQKEPDIRPRLNGNQKHSVLYFQV